MAERDNGALAPIDRLIDGLASRSLVLILLGISASLPQIAFSERAGLAPA
jgi:hypothetical protein